MWIVDCVMEVEVEWIVLWWPEQEVVGGGGDGVEWIGLWRRELKVEWELKMMIMWSKPVEQ